MHSMFTRNLPRSTREDHVFGVPQWCCVYKDRCYHMHLLLQHVPKWRLRDEHGKNSMRAVCHPAMA